MKKTLSVLLALALIATTILSVEIFAEDNITVELNGEAVTFDVPPQLIDKRTMVPMRKIFEELGATVKWDDETRTVSARRNKKTITLTIDEPVLTIDKGDVDEEGNPIVTTVELDTPPQLVSQRTLVPVRAISEAFGLDVSWDDANNKVIISKSKKDSTLPENKASINLSELTAQDGVEVEGNKVKITSGGTFSVTGTTDDGSITVSTKEKVVLVLDNATITSSEGPCIFVEKADDITIDVANTNNLNAKNSADGAIYSKEDITIKGEGTLNIVSGQGHAIKASDNLTIEGANFVLDAFSDGLHINDTFEMTGGNLDITAVGDGIDSESIINIQGGKINITTTGTPTANTPEEVDFEKSSKGINAVWMLNVSGGTISVNSASHAIDCDDAMEIKGGNFVLASEYEKGITAEGNLLIDGDTVIDITKSTEGIESKNVLTINSGDIKIISTDDAINATGGKSGEMFGMFGGGRGEGAQPPKGFQMPEGFEIPEGGFTMPEGFVRPEGEAVRPQGEFTVPEGENARPQGENTRPQRGQRPQGQMGAEGMAPPEGGFTMPEGFARPEGEMPPAEGRQPQGGRMPQGGMGGMGGMMGRDMKDCLIINGGTIEIYGADDGLDANGDIIINGGTIKGNIKNGSFSGNFGIIDADGQIVISEKATIILAAGSGNERSLTTEQNTVIVYCKEQQQSETITLKDSDGNVVYEYTPAGNFAAILIASDKLGTGKTYTLTVGSENHEIVISEKQVVVGTPSASGNRFGRFGM